jgi:hypothetical protein
MSLYGRTDSNANKTKVATTIATTSVTPTIVFVDETEASLTANKNRGINGPGWWSYFTYTDTEGNTRHKAEKLMHLNNADVNANETQSDDTIAADIATTITISSQPSNQSTFTPAGGILTVDTIGAADALRVEDTYIIDATDYTTDGVGTGATFTVVVDGTGAATITVEDAGSGFVVDETITIADADLGGGGAADLTFDVATVATAAATFTVTATASSGSPVYQWQVQTSGSTRWSNVSGATSASLALTGVTTADTGKKYRVKVTSSAGAPEVISNAATLTVTSA